ncbi:MAG TPA: hypothetical protein PLP05_09455 [Sedimentisphaerales bacterium]|nr:hypothetical protein [Sedimentisphaerales bacterium]
MDKLIKITLILALTSSLFLRTIVPLLEKTPDFSPFEPRVYFFGQQAAPELPAIKLTSQHDNDFHGLSFSTLEKGSENKSAYTLYQCCSSENIDYSQNASLFCQRTLLII